MLTGYMPSRFGIQSNGGNTRLPADIDKQAMGWLFRNAGYETAYGGKVHVPTKITDCGFDVLTANQRDELATECVAFLKRPHDKPFLLVASFINPHDICFVDFAEDKPAKAAPSKEKLKAYEDEEGSLEEKASAAAALKRPGGVSEEEFFAKHCPPLPSTFEATDNPRTHHWSVEQRRQHGWAYCRLTEQVDRQIGQVLQALRDAELEENTLVVFTSDHGELNGAHGLIRKGVFFEEAARVPFIVSLKGVTKPGLVDNQHFVSSGLDLIPTLCDFAGIKPPVALRGRSVRALAEGRAAQEWRTYVVSEMPGSRQDGLFGPLQILRLCKRCAPQRAESSRNHGSLRSDDRFGRAGLHARSRPPCALRVRDEFLLLDTFLTHGLRMGQGPAVREKIQQVRRISGSRTLASDSVAVMTGISGCPAWRTVRQSAEPVATAAAENHVLPPAQHISLGSQRRHDFVTLELHLFLNREAVPPHSPRSVAVTPRHPG